MKSPVVIHSSVYRPGGDIKCFYLGHDDTGRWGFCLYYRCWEIVENSLSFIPYCSEHTGLFKSKNI